MSRVLVVLAILAGALGAACTPLTATVLSTTAPTALVVRTAL